MGQCVGWLDRRFQHFRNRLVRTGLGTDGKKCVGQRHAFVGVIKNLPVAQLTACAQRNIARTDAPQRKGRGTRSMGKGAQRIKRLCHRVSHALGF